MTSDQNLFSYLASLMDQGKEPDRLADDIWSRYGRRVAVVVIDSVGFSRVSQQHGIIHFMTRLVRLRRLVTPVIESFAPVEFKFEADNIFLAFEDVDQAVSVSLAIHEAVSGDGLMLTQEEPFKVCIGIGYGDLLYSETLEGFFGEEMNLASKLGEDLADGGETLLTLAALEAADPRLTRDFTRDSTNISGVDLEFSRHVFTEDP